MASMLQMLTTPVSGGELARLAQETRAASMQPYQPGMRERLGSALYDLFGRNATANRIRNEGMMLADFIPGVGDAIGAQEAASDYQAGNYLGAGLGGVATAMGVIPGAGDAMGRAVKSAEEPIRQGIRAFHGSPHDFDRFSMDKIGTGEGAQAYGHGLYFAESEDVARGYRNALSGNRYDANVFPNFDGIVPPEIGSAVRRYDGDMGAVRRHFERKAANGRFGGIRDEAKRSLAWLDENGASLSPQMRGSMYEVSINANPEDFLDWDRPLSEQPERIRRALEGFNLTTEIKDGMSLMPGARLRIEIDPDLPEYKKYFMEMDNGQRFRLQPNDLKNMVAQSGDEIRGNNIVSTLANQLGGERAATNALRQAGIPGIRYLDGGSRAANDGTRNYVVFDDNLISIVRKYGIAAAIAGGIITREQAEQMQAQGVI